MRVLAILTAVLALHAPTAAQPRGTLENDVKAAFLFNFTKFVEWPDAAFADAADPLRLCIMSDAAFVRSVDAIIAGETVRGRPLVRVNPVSGEFARCHVLYIGAAESERAARLVAAVARSPVLTVGESPRFSQQGGAISFVVVDNRVRFDINLRAAEQAGLTVSSKLLRVARTVEDAR